MAAFVMVCELPTREKIIKQITEITCFIILGLYYKYKKKPLNFQKNFPEIKKPLTDGGVILLFSSHFPFEFVFHNSDFSFHLFKICHIFFRVKYIYTTIIVKIFTCLIFIMVPFKIKLS